MIDILKALGATITKMFAADLWLTFIALGAVGVSLLALHSGAVAPRSIPFMLAGGVLFALIAGVVHGSHR